MNFEKWACVFLGIFDFRFAWRDGDGAAAPPIRNRVWGAPPVRKKRFAAMRKKKPRSNGPIQEEIMLASRFHGANHVNYSRPTA